MSAFPANPYRADALQLSKDTFMALRTISVLLPHEKRAIEVALAAIEKAQEVPAVPQMAAPVGQLTISASGYIDIEILRDGPLPIPKFGEPIPLYTVQEAGGTVP